MAKKMNSEELVKWAKRMGFPGADDPRFKANVGRLITPETKAMWSHLATHVRPVQEVTKIRKQNLAYKLSVENNLDQNALAKFESTTDYEAFLKRREVEAKIEFCNAKAEKKRDCLKSLSSKLVDEGERLQSYKMEEKEKIVKLRLLRQKRKELEQQVDTFKQLIHVVDYVMLPNYSHKHSSDSWELEVQKYCASLGRGQEIAMMCKELKEAHKKTSIVPEKIEDGATSNGNEALNFHTAIEEYQIGLRVKLYELNEEYITKLEELEAAKRDLIAELTSSEDISQVARASVFKTLIESGHMDDIGKVAEKNFMMEWLCNNRSRFDNTLESSYLKQTEEIDVVDSLISQIKDEISFISSTPAAKLRSTLYELVTKMKTDAMAATFKGETPSTVVDKILCDLPELIDLFQKTPFISKKEDPGTQSIQTYTDFKFKLSKTFISRAFASFNVPVKEDIKDPKLIIKHVQAKDAREESKIDMMLSNLKETLNTINQTLQSINGHLACWEKSSTTEVVYNSPDYQDVLSQVKNMNLKHC